MLVRIVKMRFRESEINRFKSLFDANKERIRNFPGCKHLVLYQDQNEPTIFFTYSYWKNAEHLEAYRHSDVFTEIWQLTKVLFDYKPEAWSLDTIAELPYLDLT